MFLCERCDGRAGLALLLEHFPEVFKVLAGSAAAASTRARSACAGVCSGSGNQLLGCGYNFLQLRDFF
jgi:hypothetical protein